MSTIGYGCGVSTLPAGCWSTPCGGSAGLTHVLTRCSTTRLSGMSECSSASSLRSRSMVRESGRGQPRTGIDTSDVVAAVNDLVSTRYPAPTRPNDRRRNIVSITRSGLGALERVGRVIDAVQDEVLEPLSIADGHAHAAAREAPLIGPTQPMLPRSDHHRRTALPSIHRALTTTDNPTGESGAGASFIRRLHGRPRCDRSAVPSHLAGGQRGPPTSGAHLDPVPTVVAGHRYGGQISLHSGPTRRCRRLGVHRQVRARRGESIGAARSRRTDARAGASAHRRTRLFLAAQDDFCTTSPPTSSRSRPT